MVVGVGAVVVRIVAGTHLGGVGEFGLLRVGGQIVHQLLLVDPVYGTHQRRRLELAGSLLTHFEGRARQIAHVAVAGGIDKDLGVYLEFPTLAKEGNGF